MTQTDAPTVDTATRGQVLKSEDGLVVFQPAGTNYQLHLAASARYSGPIDAPVKALVRAQARKVYTVPSGGAFIAPIVGPPRTIQGRVERLDGTSMIVQAGARVVVALPAGPDGIDLNVGPITVGKMVNVTALPGASFELTK
jgi:hypothetical protein